MESWQAFGFGPEIPPPLVMDEQMNNLLTRTSPSPSPLSSPAATITSTSSGNRRSAQASGQATSPSVGRRPSASNGRLILPPLPQGPSPPGRSSSPRFHSSMTTPASITSRHSRNNASATNRPSTPSRLGPRQTSPFLFQRNNNNVDPPIEWGNDTVAAADDSLYFGNLPSFADDPFLASLVENEFSSPSTYPPFITSGSQPQSPVRPGLPLAQTPSLHQLPGYQASSTSASATNLTFPPPSLAGQSHTRQRSNLNPAFFAASPSRSDTQLTNSTIQSFSSGNDLFADASLHRNNTANLFPTPETSFSSFDAMPITRRRAAQNAAPTTSDESPPDNKRRRTSTGGDPRPVSQQSDHDLWGSSPSRPGTGLSSKQEDEDFDTIDLTEATEVPEELRKPVVDNRIKLSAFQCVICMDDATNLTVTSCGHLFCAQCLHSSLSVESTRGKCPMCRSKIDMKARASYTSKTKGFWPLELKLMTTTRQGKRKANIIS